MVTRNSSLPVRIALSVGIAFSAAGIAVCSAVTQAPAPAGPSATASQLGTIKAIAGNTLTMASDKGQTVTISVAPGAKVYQLPVGSTDLKTAKPGQLTDIAVGDRAMVTGKAGDTPETLTAVRVILMKSSDIAQMQEQQQADWKLRGTGGIVSTVDPASGAITLTSGTKKLTITTTSKTSFKRFAGDSVKYQDAKPGKITDIQAKDQLQARGEKSADGNSMQAEEVISGSFENLSGQLLTVDAAGGKITLKDLATKKIVTVNVTANSEVKSMPAMVAARFASQSSGGGQGAGRRGGGGGGQDTSAGGDNGARRSAGADLSQMIGRLPAITLADLKKGDAVMIVASDPMAGSSAATAITVLNGVDAILTANPNGGMDLSMSVSGGGGNAE
ncbi:MAG: hypothetical protein M3O31_05145 [Acidobacteriota bacterium]|nr:hypothetical protein [Acidobacteriota bacterium]